MINGLIKGRVFGSYFNYFYLIFILFPCFFLLIKERELSEMLFLYYLISDLIFNLIIRSLIKAYREDFKQKILTLSYNDYPKN